MHIVDLVMDHLSGWACSTAPGVVPKLNEAVQFLLDSLAGHQPILADTVDPRITVAIDHIRSSLQDQTSIKSVAAKCFLSESRFAHLFKIQTGIPYRRYVLWCRLQTAMLAIQKGANFTDAAFEAGFSDGAHLSRTFTDMFGVAPSEVLK
ncbi:AraC family transcriptional regulator [Flaviaesturariibacter amylovorans]|uniref:HTH araC/xylS-type domain-containing protein n=1 Tax=Flaviaesturariibacter amylovorans TaxID=1084520 RepID=A0ABP8HL62_9BACT